MSRADELRRQLADLEAEESAQADLSAARTAYRASPDDQKAKAAAQDAAARLREVRKLQRETRAADGPQPTQDGDARVDLDVVSAAGTVREVTL